MVQVPPSQLEVILKALNGAQLLHWATFKQRREAQQQKEAQREKEEKEADLHKQIRALQETMKQQQERERNKSVKYQKFPYNSDKQINTHRQWRSIKD